MLSSCNVQARLGESPALPPTSGGRQPQSDLPSKVSSAGSGSLQAWDSSISPLVSSFKAASEGLGNEVSGSPRRQSVLLRINLNQALVWATTEVKKHALQVLKAGQVVENAFKVSFLAPTPCIHSYADLLLCCTAHHLLLPSTSALEDI